MFKKILNNSFWLLIGNSIGRLSMFVANILAARVLSQDVFGQYMMIRNTIALVSNTISASVGNITVKVISENNNKINSKLLNLIISIFLINIIISILVIVILAIFSELIVTKYFLGEESMIIGFYIGSLIFMGSLLSLLVQQVLIGFESYIPIAVTGVINTVISIPIIYFLIKNYALIGVLFGVSIYFFNDFILKSFYLFRKIKNIEYKYSFNLIKNVIKNILSSSIPLIFSVLITGFLFWYIRVLIIDKTGGFTDIAKFDAAYQWLTIIMLITGATTSVSLQMFSVYSDRKERNVKQIFYLNLFVNIVISVFFALIFSIFSKEIMSLYGKKYEAYYYLLYFLGIIAVLSTVSSIMNKLLIAGNDQNYILFNNLLSSLITFLFVEYLNISNKLLLLVFALILYYVISVFLYLIRIFIFRSVSFKNEGFF